MALVIFDLDNTLIAGDSDHSWGQFLIDKHLVNADDYQAANNQFLQDYNDAKLDIDAYLHFALAPLREHTMSDLHQLHQQFMQEVIEGLILPKGEALIANHRRNGDVTMIITATNQFITGPIAKRLNVDHLLASGAEIIDNRYTGKPSGIPCYQEGKVKRLRAWLKDEQQTLHDSYFYSDSINDVPLLEQVTHPIAVDPCPRLKEYALAHAVPTISLR